MNDEEHKIICLLKQGDNAAYKFIYDYHYLLLCAVAYEYLKDDFLAETIVDDLIFHLWEKRETIEITTSLRSYLVRAVRNRCINHLNLRKEKKEVSFSSIDPNQKDKVLYSEAFDYPLAVLLENELEEQVSQAISNLPEECRRVFRMSRLEEKKYEEIATELGISVNTVKYHIKNALTRLSNELAKYLVSLIFFLLFF